ncbi:MAG: hypothetical protein ABS62_13195 [Microbacterium sp. SCN 70-200]|uniref:glycosyltransferase n=1 Tax=unclassified Microbacterium TaxID=2609290 RepID=UPI00086F8488|nr:MULTISPECIES: nucleotide disphospho-sugar-binding domain-containing protein [unclassified Microbacterium]MBN9213997.1 hypothetical protein [Microbacterium sp.]ODT39466.1 MAG: hypothetical protein ABS62_13195 [Microbacterium sp. SCN 70-200]OJV82880.1 MAG: hypothetical protein BGO46_01120 [Microbacterium sp. 70-16]
MERFMVTAMPFSGHVAPLAAVAAALVERGHDVRFYTGAAFQAQVEATGARFVPWRAAPDFDEQNLAATFPRLVGKKGFSQLMINMEDLFISTAPAQLDDVRAEWQRAPWDVLVSDEASIAPSIIAEAIGCRWATVAVLPLHLMSPAGPPPGLGLRPGRTVVGRARDAALRALVPALSGRLKTAANRAREAVGLPAASVGFEHQVWTHDLILASGCPALDFDLPDRPDFLHWVGRLSTPIAIPAPPWWCDLDGRRVIAVTQGTQNVDPTDLLQPALEALADEDAIVVATTGVRGVDPLPFAVPRNVRTASRVPFDDLFPRLDVLVTNGGWGGVLTALSHGVPLVVAGGDLDKPEVAGRVAAAGAGVNLKTGRPKPAAVRAAAAEVTAHPSYRQRARAVAAQLAAAGDAARAAELLEAL